MLLCIWKISSRDRRDFNINKYINEFKKDVESIYILYLYIYTIKNVECIPIFIILWLIALNLYIIYLFSRLLNDKTHFNNIKKN